MQAAKPLLTLLCSLFVALSVRAGDTQWVDDTATTETTATAITFTHELDLDYGYVADARMETGDGSGDVAEHSFLIRYVAVGQVENWPLLRLGAEWRRYSFDVPANAILPDTLQSISIVVGADIAIGDWLVRVEAQPGFYSDDHVSGDDFNVPFVIGGVYLYSTDVQFVLALSVDVNRDYPVLPAVGVRWKFANRWLLNGILPRPRLEYELNDKFTLYAGGEFRSGSYRVDDRFGSSHGDPRLDDAWVDYTEIRAGGGISWKLAESITADIEAGALL